MNTFSLNCERIWSYIRYLMKVFCMLTHYREECQRFSASKTLTGPVECFQCDSGRGLPEANNAAVMWTARGAGRRREGRHALGSWLFCSTHAAWRNIRPLWSPETRPVTQSDCEAKLQTANDKRCLKPGINHWYSYKENWKWIWKLTEFNSNVFPYLCFLFLSNFIV